MRAHGCDLPGRGAAHLRAARVERRTHRLGAHPAPDHPGRWPPPPGPGASWAERGEREGWDLRVMYGQTEATARMAVTAPGAAAQEPSIGRACPVGRGRFSVRDAAGDVPAGRSGDLHFTGTNVMLGYALSPDDLARGRDVTDLATGDLARLRADGTLEIVGRRSSFLKVNGVRLDVERVEQLLAEAGLTALVGGSDERLLALVVADDARERHAAPRAGDPHPGRATGLPAHRVGVAAVPALPRTPNGKLDRAAVGPTFDLLATTATARPTGRRPRPGRAVRRACWRGPTRRGLHLRRPRRRLAVVRRAVAAPRGAARPAARRLATAPDPRARHRRAPPRRRLARVDTTIVLRAARHPGDRGLAHPGSPRARRRAHPARGGGLQLRPVRGERTNRARDVEAGRRHGRADRRADVPVGRRRRAAGRHLLAGQPGPGQLAVRQRHLVIDVAAVVPRGTGLDAPGLRGPAQRACSPATATHAPRSRSWPGRGRRRRAGPTRRLPSHLPARAGHGTGGALAGRHRLGGAGRPAAAASGSC